MLAEGALGLSLLGQRLPVAAKAREFQLFEQQRQHHLLTVPIVLVSTPLNDARVPQLSMYLFQMQLGAEFQRQALQGQF